MGHGLRATAARGVLVAVAASAFAVANAAPQTLEFRLAPKKGDAFEIRLHRIVRSLAWEDYKGEVTEKRLAVGSQDVKVDYRVRVLAAEPGAVEVEIAFTSTSGAIETVEGPYTWESSKGTSLPDDWTVARKVATLASLAGAKCSATLDATGRVLKTKGLREAYAKALEKVAMPAHVRAQGPTDEDLAAIVQSFLPAPPQGSWTVGTPREDVGAVKWAGVDSSFKTRRTLRTATETEATIEETWTYDPPKHEIPEEVLRDEGAGRGATVWSRADGWILRSKRSVTHAFASKFGRKIEDSLVETFERVNSPVPPPDKPK